MTGIQCRIPPRKLLSAPQSRIIYRTFCKFVEFVLKEPQFYDFFNKNERNLRDTVNKKPKKLPANWHRPNKVYV